MWQQASWLMAVSTLALNGSAILYIKLIMSVMESINNNNMAENKLNITY